MATKKKTRTKKTTKKEPRFIKDGVDIYIHTSDFVSQLLDTNNPAMIDLAYALGAWVEQKRK